MTTEPEAVNAMPIQLIPSTTQPDGFRPFFNPATGEWITFTVTAADNGGQLVRFTWHSVPGGVITEHVHPHQEERFTILAGEAHFTLNGTELVAGPGETVVVPAGVPHSEGNPGPAEIEGVVELRPALYSKEWHEALAGLVADGKTTARGAPKNPLQLGATFWHFRHESRVTSPPVWAQNLMLPPLWALAKAFGVHPYYPRWDSRTRTAGSGYPRLPRSGDAGGGHSRRLLPMTDSPAIVLAAGGPETRPRGGGLAPARYRHPGDVIRLIAAALVLAAAAVVAALLPALLRPAAAVTGVGPATAAGQVLTGLVQVTIAAAALVLLAAALRHRRFRVLVTVAGGFAAAAVLMAGITYLAGPGGPAPAGLRQGSWLAGAGFPDPAVLAGLAAVAVAAAPWLSRPWRRACWAMLLLIGAARLITGGLLPVQLVLALATGVTVGAGLLVVFGVPDRRMGAAGVAAALRAGGVPVSEVSGPVRPAKGSRPFQAVTGDGRGLFVKVFGSDQRDADLLYRAWRGLRLRGVGDTRPAASLFKAVEHEALLGVMAGSLRQAAASPVKLGLLFGGSALITLAYIAALAASIQAFGRGPGLIALGAVYLAAAALAAAAPTPGGLGAIEAALVAGLTGVGMQAGPAVSAVLLYRLATYWLPVLPGWLCWRSLQHREYV